jgi:hypothetical protein
VRAEQLRGRFNKGYKPDVAYSCRHSFDDEARLIGHSVKRAIGTNAQYGSPDVLLPAAKK